MMHVSTSTVNEVETIEANEKIWQVNKGAVHGLFSY